MIGIPNLNVPRWVWPLVAAAVLIGIVFAYGRHERNAGRAEIKYEWDQAVERGKAEIARLELAASTVSVVTEVKYVDRVKIIKEKADVIERVREVFVPTDSGMLSGGFRLYYDAAVTNTVPNPASIADAAPISVTDVADTSAANFEKCHIAYETVEKFQLWANEQCKLNTNGCPPNG